MEIKKKNVSLTFLIILSFTAIVLNCRYKILAYNNRKSDKLEYSDFSIMSFNISALDTTKFTTMDQNKLLDLIKSTKPDILCFQEFAFANLKEIKPQLDSLYGSCDILKGDNQLWRLRFYSHFPLRNFRKYKCKGDIYTEDLTKLEQEEIEVRKKQMRIMSAEFEVKPGKWITLFSGHLRSSAYSTARRSMNKDASWFQGISLYKRNYKVGKRIRDYEAENVRRFIDEARVEGKPVIVAGDLNDWCGSDCLNVLMRNDLKDAWWEGGCGFGWTYFGWHMRLRLDHILYSDELELVDVKVVDSDLSDHKPLIAKFLLN